MNNPRKFLFSLFFLAFSLLYMSLPVPGMAEEKKVKSVYFFTQDGKPISSGEVISLTPGIQHVIQARAFYEDGTDSVVSDQALWSSSNPKAVAIIDGSFGLLETVAEGTAIVTASYAGKTVFVKFSVSPAVSLTASLDVNTSYRNVRTESGRLIMENGSIANIIVNALLADGTKKEVTRITEVKPENQEIAAVIYYGEKEREHLKGLAALTEGSTEVTLTLDHAKTILSVEVVPKRKAILLRNSDAYVHFNDPGLEDAVREAIKKPAGEITVADMARLTELSCFTNDLTGLEYAANLKKLALSCGFLLRDISALAGLTNLQELRISPPSAGGWGELTDLSPLAGLINLEKLVIYGEFSDISPLANLVNLRELRLFSNQVSDVSALAGLKGLEALMLNGKPVDPGPKISVIINGVVQTYDQPPMILNGRTLVPLRGIFEALEADVSWDQETQTVTATKEGTTIRLTIGSNKANKNGEDINLDEPPQLINDRTMVPVRFVVESLGAKVDWDQRTRTVFITK